jgi:ABC-type polysaccharide/polyol phosphate transport system ATPase subunit
MYAIEFRNVSKSFVKHSGHLLMRQRLAELLENRPALRFQALKNVSFQLKCGESLAVVGPNGAGKSTLLSVVAGLAAPDEGTVELNGRVAALLELGSGFHIDLTGRENVFLNAALLGLTRKETLKAFDEIVEFSGIGDFIEEPLRTYSSGMVLRLAFSVAINTDPDVLLVDEILTVGDHSFQAKCFERIQRFRRAGKTILAVSHAQGMVEEICDRALWLDHGQAVMQGRIREVLDAYLGRTKPVIAESIER